METLSHPWALGPVIRLGVFFNSVFGRRPLLRRSRRNRGRGSARWHGPRHPGDVDYRRLAESAGDVIVQFDRSQCIRYMSSAAEEILGCRPERLLGSDASVLTHPADRDILEVAFAALHGGSRTVVTHRAHRFDDGREIWIECSLRNLDDPAGAAGDGGGGTVGILRDVSVRHHIEHALRDTNDQLAEEADQLDEARNLAVQRSQAKSNFLAAVSHELRTPLNAVIGFSEIMRRQIYGPVGNDRYLEYAGDIQYSGEHLLGLINDILDFSKAEAGELCLELAEVDLRSVLGSALRMIGPLAERAEVMLEDGRVPALPRIRGDERRLRQILLNLLGNAVKFTPVGGRVRVDGTVLDDGAVVLSVTDTGVGIAAEELASIFVPFRQATNRAGEPREGTGLGLPLTKHLVDLHGGELSLESELGHGTAVTIIFPCSSRCSPAGA